MQVIVIGKSYTAKKITEKLCENKDNIIFSSLNISGAVFLDINTKDIDALKDFIIANEVGLLIVSDESFIQEDYGEIINETKCQVFCPDIFGARFCLNLSSGKKLIYKNKIQTPKFAVFEKAQNAVDYLNQAAFPVIISPDKINETEGFYIAETKKKADLEVEKLFQTGNKKILIEDYIQGIEYTKYLLLDGFNALDFLEVVSYFDEFKTNNTCYIKTVSYQKIQNEIVPKIMDCFMEDGIEYTGILGFNFVIDKNGGVYLRRFKPFLDELDIDIALNTIEDDFLKLFYHAALGDLYDNFEKIQTNSRYAVSFDTEGEITSASAGTMTRALELAFFEGAKKEIADEAIKLWRR